MKAIYVVLLLSLPIMCQAQQKPANLKAVVKEEATKMGKALLDKDYQKFVATTYPKAFETTEGGKETLLHELEEQIRAMEAQGSYILKLWPENASDIVDTARELQCTIPQYMELKVPEGKVKTETTLVVLSPDRGKKWYFIDAAGKNIGELRELFPNLSSKLVIPASPEPVFTPDK